jgi:hypothetical protein
VCVCVVGETWHRDKITGQNWEPCPFFLQIYFKEAAQGWLLPSENCTSCVLLTVRLFGILWYGVWKNLLGWGSWKGSAWGLLSAIPLIRIILQFSLPPRHLIYLIFL